VALALHTAKSPDPRTMGAPCRRTGEATAAGCAVRLVSGLLGAAQGDAGPAHRARGGVHAALREGHRAPHAAARGEGEVCCTPCSIYISSNALLEVGAVVFTREVLDAVHHCQERARGGTPAILRHLQRRVGARTFTQFGCFIVIYK